MLPAALHLSTFPLSLQFLVVLSPPRCPHSLSQRRYYIAVSSEVPCVSGESSYRISSPVPVLKVCPVSCGADSMPFRLQSFLIERAGRKTLLWKSYAVMALALGLLTVTLSLQVRLYLRIIELSGVLCSLPTEIFIQSYRPAAYVFNGSINWIQLFILGLLFPFIVEGLGSFCFIIFLTYCLSMAIFVFLVMPETKGKTILQVMEEFNCLNYRGKKKQTILEQSNCSVVTVTRL
uniref:Major facilitator superfamily (MFS) profile domain-containing protein n=1 Tax=Strigops habroptila TaxID=2489341 RepID=A0A672UVF2_STRHB